MKAIIRKDENAVSPVIATILMVAITVVLAAVLYVMVSGLITSPGSTPKPFVATITKSANGANWVVTFSAVSTGLTAGTTFLTIKYASGAADVSQRLLSTANNGTISYNPAAGGAATTATVLGPSDTILLATSAYLSGYQVQLSTSSQILYTGTLS